MTRDSNRERFPELAKVMDHYRALYGNPVMRCIRDADGNIVAGKEPEPDHGCILMPALPTRRSHTARGDE